MTGAMNALTDGLFGINKPPDEFGVPRTTLKDRHSGKVVHGTKSGPTLYLSGEEEDELAKFLLTSPAKDKKQSHRNCTKSSYKEERDR